ncbi:hypothetical protein BDW59DRAFT_152484 [Aspergillus cavernicola]|uniref:Mid2 domain-containing protein n=1 Tax=Aspergillus cavernicola TaxID=176166 RepID=A0ABR4HQC4_9EURO
MARFPTFWSAYLALVLVLPWASAWTVLWRNETISAEVIDGQSEQNCTQIWHQEGEQFSFDPEGPWCLKFYRDPNCESSNGISCDGRFWRQVASQNLSAFNVYAMPPASRTSFGFVSTSATPTADSSTTTTETLTPTAPSADETPAAEASSGEDDSELSGGAIAGIAIGVVVAVAFLCAACFYLGRRSGRKAAAAARAAPLSNPSPPDQPNTSTNSTSPPSPPPSTTPTVNGPLPVVAELPKPPMVETPLSIYSPAPITYIQPPNGVRMVELQGQNAGVELSNTRQIQELQNSRQVQELEGQGVVKSGTNSWS